MGGNRDGDQRVAGRAAAVAGLALTAQPDLLPVLDAWWNADVELLVVERDPPVAAQRGLVERYCGLELDVRALALLIAAAAASSSQPAKDVGKYVLGGEASLLVAPVEIGAAPALLPAESFPA